MEKLGLLYQGKAKKLYATEDPEVLWVEYLNQATAGNGAKKEQIVGKAELNNRITTLIFDELKRVGIDSHLVKQISPTDQLVRKMTMFPLEIVQRNVAAGSFSKRLGVDEGTALKEPVLEYYFKSDPLNDPFINDDDAVALGLATREELAQIATLARTINVKLTALFASIDVRLVDFKIEMGKTSDGEILLADEITPDTCRLWDLRSGADAEGDGAVKVGQIERLDKDIFRKDLGSILPAYHEILGRLENLAASH
jgi:phosphoribosylaminoimidazole-succinocarboxamide synthase